MGDGRGSDVGRARVGQQNGKYFKLRHTHTERARSTAAHAPGPKTTPAMSLVNWRPSPAAAPTANHPRLLPS